MAKTKKPSTTQIRRLGIGSIFAVTVRGVQENWKVIGRPGKSGKENGKDAYHVKAIYVPTSKDDPYTPSKEAKYFNINQEVEEVRPARKDFDAIDQRDQPEEVQSIEKMAAQLGTEFQVEDGDNIEELVEDK